MLEQLLLAGAFFVACVAVHLGGTLAIFSRFGRQSQKLTYHSPSLYLLLMFAIWLLLALHVTEILFWALGYVWLGALKDFSSGFYFSIVTYATVGYGDMILSPAWRIFGALEGLTGTLLVGWSTGIIFTVFSLLLRARIEHLTRGIYRPSGSD